MGYLAQNNKDEIISEILAVVKKELENPKVDIHKIYFDRYPLPLVTTIGVPNFPETGVNLYIKIRYKDPQIDP